MEDYHERIHDINPESITRGSECNMEDRSNVKYVQLKRSNTLGFGFSIIGGSGSDLPPVICDIVENSPADFSEELGAGDVIVAVNGVEVGSFSTKEVLRHLRISGPTLHLKLKEEPEVRQRAERFFNCPPEDIDTLRDAISQKDLTGVEELIVKRHTSPSQSPKKKRNVPHDSAVRSPGMPKKMDGEPVNGKGGSLQENGLHIGPAGKHESSPSACKKTERRFETFVMTGDMIIKTTAPTKSEAKRQAEKRANESSQCEEQAGKRSTGASPLKEAKKGNKGSRIPKPSSVKNSPRESPRTTPRESPKPSPKHSPKKSVTEPKPEPVESPKKVVPAPRQPEGQENVDPQQLELLGYPRYRDVPMALDIPPDDISSEDEKYKMEGIVNIDDLPPPPDYFLEEFQAPKSNELKVSPLRQDNVSGDSGLVVCDTYERPDPAPTDVNASSSLPSQSQDTTSVHTNDNMQLTDDGSAAGESRPQTEANTTSAAVVAETGVSEVPFDSQSIHSDSKVERVPDEQVNRSIVVSKSAEKIGLGKESKGIPSSGMGVRTSKSHENYLECNAENVTFVDIDIDDNIASSVDALHYEKSQTSLDRFAQIQDHEQSRSLDNSPEKKFDKHAERLMPTFFNAEAPSSIAKLKEGGKLKELGKEESRSAPPHGLAVEEGDPQWPAGVKSAGTEPQTGSSESSAMDASESPQLPNAPSAPSEADTSRVLPGEPDVVIEGTAGAPGVEGQTDNVPNLTSSPGPKHRAVEEIRNSDGVKSPSGAIEEGACGVLPGDASKNIPRNEQSPGSPAHSNGESDADSIYHQPIKDVDRPSAARLAKRLFNLDGFKKGDISRHLSKKNEFAQLVGEEYLKYFHFTDDTLDAALRKFLKQLTLVGETQERERVLAHFSARFMLNNPNSFNSEDACHTLTCALMLLNTDLHGQNLGRKMTANDFVENLADLNDGENFPKEVLRNLYFSLKAEPLECEIEDDEKGGANDDQLKYVGHNPFLEIPDPSKATEYKKGYVMRKCCVDADGRKTPLGKRGWKMFYATLRDMVFYLHKDEHGFKKNALYDNMSNAIRIHHALATKATDYKKKQHVFRLQTSDWAQFLFQTSDSKECQEWIDTINFVAASLSAPPLAGGVGSQKKFQRPLMPSSYTKLNLREQLQHHEQRVQDMERDMHEHRKNPPEKGTKSRLIQDYVEKEAFLQFELKRFKTYSYLLSSKMASYPELEPSLVEVAIGEVDEPPSPPGGASPDLPRSSSSPTADRRSKPVQRSLSDRTVRSSEPKEGPTEPLVVRDQADTGSPHRRDLAADVTDSVRTPSSLGRPLVKDRVASALVRRLYSDNPNKPEPEPKKADLVGNASVDYKLAKPKETKKSIEREQPKKQIQTVPPEETREIMITGPPCPTADTISLVTPKQKKKISGADRSPQKTPKFERMDSGRCSGSGRKKKSKSKNSPEHQSQTAVPSHEERDLAQAHYVTKVTVTSDAGQLPPGVGVPQESRRPQSGESWSGSFPWGSSIPQPVHGRQSQAICRTVHTEPSGKMAVTVSMSPGQSRRQADPAQQFVQSPPPPPPHVHQDQVVPPASAPLISGGHYVSPPAPRPVPPRYLDQFNNPRANFVFVPPPRQPLTNEKHGKRGKPPPGHAVPVDHHFYYNVSVPSPAAPYTVKVPTPSAIGAPIHGTRERRRKHQHIALPPDRDEYVQPDQPKYVPPSRPMIQTGGNSSPKYFPMQGTPRSHAAPSQRKHQHPSSGSRHSRQQTSPQRANRVVLTPHSFETQV